MVVWARMALDVLGSEGVVRSTLDRRALIVLGERGRADFSHDVALHLACLVKGSENCPFVE